MSGWAIFGIVIAAVAILAIGTYVFIGLFFYGVSVNRKALVGGIISRHLKKYMKRYKIDRTWWDKQKPEELQIKTGKEKLFGYLIRNSAGGNKLAILVHGYYVTHRDVNAQAAVFLKNGFHIFAPDLRAHGKSSGRTIGMGAYEKSDMLLWIDKLVEIFGKKINIALFGISMGGATVCLVSGENPKNVKCIVSDCAYDSLESEFRHVLKEKINLPEFPVLKIASRFISLIGKYKVKDIKPSEAVAQSKIPILFIHGLADELVPAYMVQNLYESSNKEKCSIHLVEGAGHALSFAKNPKEYERIMMDFVNKHLK